MNEALLERISQLEHQLRRWRRISVLLAFLLICVVAVGGTFTAIPATLEPGEFWLWLPWVRAARERAAMEDAIRAMQAEQDLQVLQAVEEMRAAKERDEAAKKQP
jgi:hypothetical protein